MKRIRIFLLVSFILGLALFQVKFVTDSDNLNLIADVSLSQKANANPEIMTPKPPTGGSGIYFSDSQVDEGSCGSVTTTVYTYYIFDDDSETWVSVGSASYVNGEYKDGYFGWYDKVEKTTTTTKIFGWRTTCQAGNRQCTPGLQCSNY